MKEMLNYYEGLSFIREDGSFNTTTICIYFTEILKQYGLIGNGKMQRCGNITIYPKEYFCPFNDQTGVLNKTEIHMQFIGILRHGWNQNRKSETRSQEYYIGFWNGVL